MRLFVVGQESPHREEWDRYFSRYVVLLAPSPEVARLAAFKHYPEYLFKMVNGEVPVTELQYHLLENEDGVI